MKIVIYLDQNVLSNLRERKINEEQNQTFIKLKNILTSDKILVVYSHITLIEVQQIDNEEFRLEHIETLEEMKALYIEPKSRILREEGPLQIWKEFLENEELNTQLGIDKLMPAMYLSQRKISGLPISESFFEIDKQQKQSLFDLVFNMEEELLQIDLESELESLDESRKIMIRKNLLLLYAGLGFLKERISQLKKLEIAENQLGPLSFRASPEVEALSINQVSPEDVVNTIESLFKKENKDFNFSDYMEDTQQNRVGYAYELMNWVGYYPDDFNKIKKRKDRFKASRNDMMHVVVGLNTSFLISGDENFLKKAQACYYYVNSETVVCTPTELVSNYFFDI